MLEQWAYATLLSLIIVCLVMVDYRWQLAFYSEPRKALRVLLISLGCFALWDVAGIGAKIFYTGTSPYITRLFIVRDFPIEELLFLTVLVYTTLLMWRGGERR